MQKIIVRFPNWLGDLVMAQPILAALKETYPESELTALVKSPLHLVLKNDPSLDHLWLLEDSPPARLKREKFDLGVLLTNSFSSALHFFQGRVKKRLGYKSDLRSLLLNLRAPFNKKKEHQFISYQRVLSPLNFPFAFEPPHLYLSGVEKEQAHKRLLDLGYRKNKKLIAFSPFAAFGKAKCWPLENYLSLAKKLIAKKDAYVLFLGEKVFQKELDRRVKDDRFLNLVGKTTLRELIALLNEADLVVANDSGPMHLAAALNTPLIALFGSTSPVLTGPFYGQKAEVIYKKFDCSPCYKRECERKNFCLAEITVVEVFNKIVEKAYV